MKRRSVESRALTSVGYDSEEGILEVEFSSGRIYQYLRVEPSVYEWLMRTSGKAAFLNRKVVGHYQEKEVTPLPPEQDLLDALRASVHEQLGRES